MPDPKPRSTPMAAKAPATPTYSGGYFSPNYFASGYFPAAYFAPAGKPKGK